MNATIRRVHWSMGTAALLALAAGCAGREDRPAEPVGRTPTFESQTPYEEGAQTPGATPGGRDRPTSPGLDSMREPGMTPPGPGARPVQPGDGAVGEHGGMGEHGGGMGEHGGAMMADVNERRLCDELTENASLSVDNIPGGVQIKVTPKSDTDAGSIRQLADRMESYFGALSQPGQQPGGDTGSRCELFDMVRMGASARVVEAPDGIRIVYTSEDAAGIPTVRQQARMFVQSTGEGKVR